MAATFDYVARVIVTNPLQVKAIACAQIKTDKIDAGLLASLRAADFLPEIWYRMRRPSVCVAW